MRHQSTRLARKQLNRSRPQSSQKGFPLFRIVLVVGLVITIYQRVGRPPANSSVDGEIQLASLSSASVSPTPVLNNSLLAPSSATALSSAALPQREWFRMESKSLGNGRVRLTYRFPYDTASWHSLCDTARIPEAVRPLLVEALLHSQERLQSLEATFALDRDGEPVSWGWRAGNQRRAYQHSSRGWQDDRGCFRSTPCPWKEFGKLSGKSQAAGVWELHQQKGEPVYSYLEGKVSSLQKEKEGWRVMVYRAPEVYAEWRGLLQLAPTIRVGAVVDAGSPIGSTGARGAQLRTWQSGRPIDPLQLWKQSWDLPIEDQNDEETL